MGDKKMSAFICNVETFKNIYGGFELYGKSIDACDKMIMEYGDMTEVVKKFYEYNVKGVNARYDEKTAIRMPAGMLKEALCGVKYISKTQFLKSLNCIHYQMAEGNVPSAKFYKDVEKLMNAVAYNIATQSAEYDKAEWQ